MTKGERIKELREKAGLTQEELAAKLKVAKQTIHKYEKNIVTNIPSDNIELLATVLDSTPEYILGWDAKIKADPVGTAELHVEMIMDEDFVEMFEDFKKLTPEAKQMVKKIVRSMANE
jgi:transcriptional regulator with XRE-family HTH domain